jgi:hypothetical protein
MGCKLPPQLYAVISGVLCAAGSLLLLLLRQAAHWRVEQQMEWCGCGAVSAAAAAAAGKAAVLVD